DRRALALNTPGEILFWDTAKQALLPLIIALNARNVETISWSQDGKLAVWEENHVLIYPLSPAALAVPQPPLPLAISTGNLRSGAIGALQWSPVEPLLSIGASNGTVVCWDVNNPGKPWQIATTGQKVTSLAWSPDGAQLVGALRDNRVLGWNVHSQHQALAWTKLPAMPRTISVSLTGRIVIASSEKRLLCGDAEEPAPSSSISGQLLAAWSPTSAELATLDAQQETTLVLWHD
ncbi:MAG: WD40 repeat domain-containing protein, partial [Ktedonobacteraceae bacterium]|nr:WD40 repeat domain-containing protein [Ktedonobacteraceae bacterium]